MHTELSALKKTDEELSARLREVEAKLKEAEESLQTLESEVPQVLDRKLHE